MAELRALWALMTFLGALAAGLFGSWFLVVLLGWPTWLAIPFGLAFAVMAMWDQASHRRT